MTRKSFWMMAFLLIFILSLCSGGAEDAKGSNTLLEEIIPQPSSVNINTGDIARSSKMTLMIYLCGSNLESEKGQASLDLDEMIRSGFKEEELNIIVMAGGAEKWHNNRISGNATCIYQIGNGAIVNLYNDGKQYNMGDPKTLLFFLNYAVSNFPADRYALVLWDHGEGSLGGVCHDELNYLTPVHLPGTEDCLSMAELSDALNGSPFTEQKLSWIGFDACLMASAEVAKTVSPYAEYMIASEETEPGTGWNYLFLREMDSSMDPVQQSELIATTYLAASRAEYPEEFLSTGKCTLSCLDLSKLGNVASALDQFISSIQVDSKSFPRISRSRRRMLAFGKGEDIDSYRDLVDLGNMTEKLSSLVDRSVYENMEKALRECVRMSVSTRIARDSFVSGLTLYFPFENEAKYVEWMKLYKDVGFTDQYRSFIQAFGKEKTGIGWEEDLVNVSMSTKKKQANRDVRTIITLDMEESQGDLVDVVKIIAVQQANENAADAWRMIALQDADITTGGSLAGEYVHTNLFLTDNSGNPSEGKNIPLYYTAGDDGLLSVPVRLVDAGGNQTNAHLICSRDETTNLVSVVAVYRYDTTTEEYSQRLMADLSDYTSMIFPVTVKRMTYYGDPGKSPLKPWREWEILETEEVVQDLSEEWNLRFIRDYLDTKTIRVAFQITDVYNHVYISDLIPIQQGSVTSGQSGWNTEYDDAYENKKIIYIDPESVEVYGKGTLSMRIQNLWGEERLISIQDVRVNGTMTEVEKIVRGKGEHKGLMPEEARDAEIKLPMEGGQTLEDVREIQLSVVFYDIEGNELHRVEVRIVRM